MLHKYLVLFITVRVNQVIRNSYLTGDKPESLASFPDMANKVCTGDMTFKRIKFSLNGSFRFIVKKLHDAFIYPFKPHTSTVSPVHTLTTSYYSDTLIIIYDPTFLHHLTLS